MPIKVFENNQPQLGQQVFVDDSAVVIGDVVIGDDSSIWPMAVVRGDVNAIVIGERTSIQDGAVCHVTHDSTYYPGGYALSVGNDVTVGHKAILHGCHIHDYALIGMGAVVMDNAVIEPHTILGANSVVPPGKVLEGGHLWVGSPARKIRCLTEEELDFLKYSAEHYVRLKNKYLT